MQGSVLPPTRTPTVYDAFVPATTVTLAADVIDSVWRLPSVNVICATSPDGFATAPAAEIFQGIIRAALPLESTQQRLSFAASYILLPHFRVSAEKLAAAGITEGSIRLSVVLENADDLIEDLSRALYAASKTK